MYLTTSCNTQTVKCTYVAIKYVRILYSFKKTTFLVTFLCKAPQPADTPYCNSVIQILLSYNIFIFFG